MRAAPNAGAAAAAGAAGGGGNPRRVGLSAAICLEVEFRPAFVLGRIEPGWRRSTLWSLSHSRPLLRAMWWWLTGASARREEHVLAELRAEAEAAAEQRVAAAAGGGVAAAAPQALSALPPCVQRYLELAATGAPDFK